MIVQLTVICTQTKELKMNVTVFVLKTVGGYYNVL
jgi:hypothetical protein